MATNYDIPAGNLLLTDLRDAHGMGSVQSWRGKLNFGLVLLPLDFATYTVTAGADSDDTFEPRVNGVSLVAAPVEWTTSDDATADAIVAAINANAANHRYWAIKTDTDDFSVYQRRHDADGEPVAFTMGLTEDADGTLVDFTEAGQDDAIAVLFGEADNMPAGFYELGIDLSTAYDLNETGTPRVGKITMASAAEQTWGWWHGMFNPTTIGLTGSVAQVAAEAAEELFTFSSMQRPASGATGYIVYFGAESDVTGHMLYI